MSKKVENASLDADNGQSCPGFLPYQVSSPTKTRLQCFLNAENT